MNHALIDRIARQVWKDTGRKAGDNLGDTHGVARLEHCVVHRAVALKEGEIVLRVSEEAAHVRSEVKHVGRTLARKEVRRRQSVLKVALLAG